MSKVRILLLAGLLVIVAGLTMNGCRSAHTTSAIIYIAEQNYDKAVQVVHEGFEYRDDEPDAYFYLAKAHGYLAEEAVEEDEFDEAMKNYKLAYDAYMKAVELDPEVYTDLVNEDLNYNYANRIRQATLDQNEKYYEQAEGHLRLAYAAWPDSLTPIKKIARMKMLMSVDENYADQRVDLLNEALTMLDRVLEENPAAYDLQLNKANVLAALGQNDEAGNIFKTLLAEHGDDTGLLVDIANLAIEDGDYARAGDFYVRIVDLNEKDTDAGNDGDNKAMLVSAGTWYSSANVSRFQDAIVVLDRAANLELVPTGNTMLMRVRTYYNYGKKLKAEAAAETDPVIKAELETQSKAMLNRAVEIGVAMTNNFVANADGFFYLSLAQLELGDFTASEANFKTYEQLKEAPDF